MRFSEIYVASVSYFAGRRAPHNHENPRFAHVVKQLVLASKPQVLSCLGDSLFKNQRNKTIAAIDKRLTDASERKLVKQLQRYINIDTGRSMRA